MNILFLHYLPISPSSGGVERVTYLLSEEFLKRGYGISFLSLSERDKGKPAQTVFSQEYINFVPSQKTEFSEAIESFLKNESIDIVVVLSLTDATKAALKIINKKGIPSISVLHNQPFALIGKERIVKRLTPWNSLESRGRMMKLLALLSPPLFRKIYIRRTASNYREFIDISTRFMLLSERYKPRLLQGLNGINTKSIIAINNPITFQFAPESIDFEGKENIVLFMARLTNPQKNITGFIDVWKKFEESHPGWKAIVLGDGEHSDLAKDYARRNGARNLSFEGNRKNVEDYYRKAKIYCMTSTYEGWPMVIMEAMAFGCVPIAYESFEAVAEMITDGEDGLLVKPFDNKEMVRKMSLIADSDAIRGKLMAGGIKKISNFTVDKIADQWDELLKCV